MRQIPWKRYGVWAMLFGVIGTIAIGIGWHVLSWMVWHTVSESPCFGYPTMPTAILGGTPQTGLSGGIPTMGCGQP